MFLKNLSHLIVYIFFIINTVDGKKVNKLIGGTPVDIIRYGFQVSVRWAGEHICSGMIIDEFHIITTATCVTNDKNIIYANIQVLSNTYDRNDIDELGSFNDVALVILHNDYAPRQFWANDICILKLEKSLEFNMIQQPIKLFTSERTTSQLQHFWFIGWEKILDIHSVLAKIEVTLKPQKNCEDFGQINPSQLCFKTKQETHIIENGDSGSPIVTLKLNHLYAIASLITSDPNNNYMVTTKIFTYFKWIYEIIKKT